MLPCGRQRARHDGGTLLCVIIQESVMYEEPYKWVEAVGNRRQYLDEQFIHGTPVLALPYVPGFWLLTVTKGRRNQKKIYDGLALGGMGHPADLEKLRSR